MVRVPRWCAPLALLASACASESPGEPGADAGAEPGAEVDAATAGPDAAPPPDPCEGVAPACPSPGGLVEGQGLVPIDRCAFPLEARDTWQDHGAILDQLAEVLEVVDVAGILGDLNRTAANQSAAAVPGDPPGVEQAFTWQSGDQAVEYWIPQGITSSSNAVAGGTVAGREVVVASWYYHQENDPGSTQRKGVRLAFADVTDPDAVRYRFVLLAEPTVVDGVPTFEPVNVHAGGLAWFGRYLYVVHTGVGFRVFDLERMLRVSTGKDVLGHDAETDAYYAHGYRYVLPQVETLASVSECSPRFSFVSFDRSTDPPSLLAGEYDASSVAGRLHRWPLDADSGRPALVGDGRWIPDEVFHSGHSHLQGALSVDGTYWLSSSKPPAGAGVLYRTGPGTASTSVPWNDAPEDLAYDPSHDGVWSLSEGLGARSVFRVARDAIDGSP